MALPSLISGVFGRLVSFFVFLLQSLFHEILNKKKILETTAKGPLIYTTDFCCGVSTPTPSSWFSNETRGVGGGGTSHIGVCVNDKETSSVTLKKHSFRGLVLITYLYHVKRLVAATSTLYSSIVQTQNIKCVPLKIKEQWQHWIPKVCLVAVSGGIF